MVRDERPRTGSRVINLHSRTCSVAGHQDLPVCIYPKLGYAYDLPGVQFVPHGSQKKTCANPLTLAEQFMVEQGA